MLAAGSAVKLALELTTLCCSCSCCVLFPALQHSIGINVTVQCPKSMVGRVIGKGGETIKGLQRKYHTSIQVGSQVRMTKHLCVRG